LKLQTALLAAALPFLLAAPARAQARDGGFLSLPQDRAAYSVWGAPASAGAPGMLMQRVEGGYVVRRSSSDAWSLSAHLGELELGASPVVPATGLVVPRRLRDAELGAAFTRKLGERRRWGGGVGIGSASDQPFDTIRETEFRASLFREFPARERDSWLLFLAYSNNRSFLNNIPFPGAAYVFRRPSAGLQATVGIPFVTLSYQPAPRWKLSLAAFGPTNLSAEVAARAAGPAWLFVRAERRPLQWLRAGRAERSDRLIFDRQELRLGLRGLLPGGFSAELSGGKDLRRRFYESRDASRSGAPKAELADAWAGALSISWRP
jgi:hypothetical protein